MKNIFIFGSGDLAKEIFFLIEKINKKKKTWNFHGFISKKKHENIYGYKVQNLKLIKKNYKDLSNFYAICGVMDPIVKENILNNEISKLFKLTRLIDPSVFIPDDTKIGNGSIILSNVSISYGVNINTNVVISAGTVLGHGVKIGRNSLIAPGCMLNGNTKVGSNCIINSGVSTLPKVEIGNNCIIGLGTMVFRNVINDKSIANHQRTVIYERKK